MTDSLNSLFKYALQNVYTKFIYNTFISFRSINLFSLYGSVGVKNVSLNI